MISNIIVTATGNKGKLAEMKNILSDFQIRSFKDFDVSIDVEEDQDTFEGNALKKAKAGADYFKHVLCIADDSGICIDEFDGWPGVKTARWMKGTDHEKNLAILEKMKGLPKERRKAHVVTCIAIADKLLSIATTHTMDGYISTEPRGENGFGFDEIFELEDGRTLAELSTEEKNSMSSRKIALEEIKKFINKPN